MAHTRHRKFNTKETYPEQKLDNDLAQAVVARGTMIFLRGQCPQDLDTAKNIDSHDPVEQTHKVMQNIRQLVEECGGKMEHVTKLVVYLTDVRHREAVYRTMGEYIKGVHPVSTGVVVTALARPNWLVEIDATAVIAIITALAYWALRRPLCRWRARPPPAAVQAPVVGPPWGPPTRS